MDITTSSHKHCGSEANGNTSNFWVLGGKKNLLVVLN